MFFPMFSSIVKTAAHSLGSASTRSLAHASIRSFSPASSRLMSVVATATPSTTTRSEQTQQALNNLKSKPLQLIVDINSRPFHVSRNDIIQSHSRLPLALGDVISLTRVREIASPDHVLQGAPYIDPSYFDVQATVVEIVRSKAVTETRHKRSGRARTRTDSHVHTVLRISKVEIK